MTSDAVAASSSASCDGNNIAHNAVTLALAKKESAEHLHGMKELYDSMRNKPMIVRAYELDDPAGPSTSRTNVKVVHFLRHGQGFHNLLADMAQAQGREWVQFEPSAENPYTQPELLDAPLTEKGRLQAQNLRQTKICTGDQQQLLPLEMVVFSPNCRALQTGTIVFQDYINKNIPFLAHEMVREETGVHLCDKRRSRERQKLEFPHIDFSLIDSDGDPIFRDTERESKQQVGERIYKFFEWLSKRAETHVAVSSHSGWLLTVFNGILECQSQNCDHEDKPSPLKAWFQTGEMRTVKLEFIQGDQHK